MPTNEYGAHFWAEPSRSLIKSITILRGLQRTLKDSGYAFELDSYYENIVTQSEEFLSESGGSQLPANMKKIELYYTLPIIHKLDAISIGNEHEKQRYANLKLIGEGSYAQVFSYWDPFYNRKFVLKRAKKELNEKELERFKQEYEQMKNLSSPYVTDVFFFDDVKNEYIMEYMNFTLDKYYEKYNSQLSKEDKKGIAGQILRAFKYIHSKGLLHRDISPIQYSNHCKYGI
ncbi:MAG: protein kinase family protein [Hespellia sp.]|nr:protein kinase family protein [Hespellia sp.]